MTIKSENDLHLDHPAFETLWERLDRVRATSRTVTVDKEALRAILFDHAALVREVLPTARQFNHRR